MVSSLGPDPPCPPHLQCYSAMLSRSQWDALYQVPVQATWAPEAVITPGLVIELRVPVCWGSRASSPPLPLPPPHQLRPAHPCSGLTSVLRVLLPPQPWKTGGARSSQMPFIRLEPCLPPRLLQSPLGTQHVSLDFIRIKEMSHICKQALLSQSSPAAVRRGRRGRKPCVAPCLGRTGSFIIVASISLQGRAIANKWLAGSQKETIWPTRRTYLHL